MKTDECKEADALGAGSPAAEEADRNDNSTDDDEYERNVVQHQHRVGRVVTQQYGVQERLTVDVDPHSDSEHRPATYLYDVKAQLHISATNTNPITNPNPQTELLLYFRIMCDTATPEYNWQFGLSLRIHARELQLFEFGYYSYE